MRMLLGVFFLIISGCVFATPSVFWSSFAVEPGESALLVGDSLNEVKSVTLQRDRQNINLVIHPRTKTSLVVDIPSDVQYGSYTLRLSGSAGETTHIVNMPKVLWVQSISGNAEAHVGGSLRLFGHHLDALPEGDFIVAGDRSIVLPVLKASRWQIELSVPENVPLGERSIAFLAKKGGSILSSMPVRFVSSRPARVVQHFSSPLPDADADIDVASALMSAMRQLSANGGGVLELASGDYVLKSGLVIPENVTLKGSDRDAVNLFWQGPINQLQRLVLLSNGSGLEELSLYAGEHPHIIATNFARETRDIVIKNILVRAMSYGGRITPDESSSILKRSLVSRAVPDAIRIRGENIQILDCDIQGSGRSLYISDSNGVYIAHNIFRNGRKGWYSLTGSSEVIFENNTIMGADLMASGGGINTIGGRAFTRNVLFANNNLESFNGWDREGMSSDGPGSFFLGGVVSLSAKRLELLGNQQARASRPVAAGQGLFVVRGTGAGQYSQIESVKGSVVTLREPLQVLPDAESLVSIVPLQENFLILNNEFRDVGRAVQFYGAAVGHVVEGNRALRSIGMTHRGLWYGGFQPAWYSLFSHNKLSGSGVLYSDRKAGVIPVPPLIMVAADKKKKEPMGVALVMGVDVKNNDVSSQGKIQVYGDASDPAALSGILMQGNIGGEQLYDLQRVDAADIWIMPSVRSRQAH